MTGESLRRPAAAFVNVERWVASSAPPLPRRRPHSLCGTPLRVYAKSAFTVWPAPLAVACVYGVRCLWHLPIRIRNFDVLRISWLLFPVEEQSNRALHNAYLNS